MERDDIRMPQQLVQLAFFYDKVTGTLVGKIRIVSNDAHFQTVSAIGDD